MLVLENSKSSIYIDLWICVSEGDGNDDIRNGGERGRELKRGEDYTNRGIRGNSAKRRHPFASSFSRKSM